MSDQKYQTERLHQGVAARYENLKTLYHAKNDLQDVILFDNPTFGRMLMLDGVTQVTLRDEFIYHEMMTHVPLFAHDKPHSVLIIGGGDGGIAREVLRHTDLQNITMVEIDKSVVDFSQEYLPEVSAGAFENPKLNLLIADGAKYVAETEDRFDIIIVDSTDPQGPGEILFTKEFYTDCKRILRENGILVTQNGVPFLQSDELKHSVGYFREIFDFGTCYRATIPTYAFGEMAMGFASDKNYRKTDIDILKERFARAALKMRYYTPEVHLAAFALPVYIEDIISASA
ncbi:MAG: polyamine aminopropyltransferase [Pseudomonadota bacterium]